MNRPLMSGMVNAEGLLIDADAELAALHRRLIGPAYGSTALPGLASLARVVRQLNVPVSRAVRVGEEGGNIDLWVRAQPMGEDVALSISWLGQELPSEGSADEQDQDFSRAVSEYRWSTDDGLILLSLSRPTAEISGNRPAVAIGQPFTRLFALLENDDGSLPLVEAVASRHPFSGQRARIRGGATDLLELSGHPLFDADGTFLGYSGTAESLSPEAQERPTETTTAPKQAQSDLGALIGAVLKSPLDKIIANADTIRAQVEGPLRSGYADYASDIAVAGRHLMGLVDDLVEVQTIEQADFAPLIEPIDLADIARRAAGLLAVRAADSSVKIDKPQEPEQLPATGEFRRVLQILVNLIGNAIRYSPSGGTVWVRVEQEADVAAVIVADQGHGIDLQDQERIFGKFERVDVTEPGGSGLGLYISRTLARAMGGDITVDSAPGQGARFILTLPARLS